MKFHLSSVVVAYSHTAMAHSVLMLSFLHAVYDCGLLASSNQVVVKVDEREDCCNIHQMVAMPTEHSRSSAVQTDKA